MAIDGAGITESDLGHDVYNQILDLYDAGLEIAEIRTRTSEYENALADAIDLEIYLAASAKAFWEIGALDASLAIRLAELVESGTSLVIWAEEASPPLAKSRRVILSRLLRQITSPKLKPRARKKFAKPKNKLFLVGDCLELKVNQRIYRGVVCKILEYRGQCDYATLVMGCNMGSGADAFAAGRYFGRGIPTSEGQLAGPHVIRLEHRMLLKAGNPFQIVGHLALDETKFMLGSFGGVLDMDDVVQGFERAQAGSVFGLEELPLRDLLSVGVVH